ncbi:protein kinase [Streptomyces sp. NPDC002795]|uniref:serine/threonine-protein kinase n=1 Tax=Streptomyces sp. NPDC002795 TaxID=3364665 RepID=UPI0036B2C139
MKQVIHERYELQGLLGRGGMGEVWAARDLRLGRHVAVKLLRLDRESSNPQRLALRFEREAQLTGRIGHPSVPQVHETGRHESDTLYIVMDLVEGHTLSTLLKERGPFPVSVAATVAVQTADVLAHAHRIRVVHRDLKPSNLMLTENGTVKVLDFGIAAALEPAPDEPRLTGTNDILGTPGFISPEQGLGKPATERSDLYALGCVLYEIVTGRPPYEIEQGASPFYLVYRHLHEKPPPVTEHRADLPGEFADLVMRLLAKEPAERPSAKEVQEVARTWTVPQASPQSATPSVAEPDAGPVQLRLTRCELLFKSEDFTRAYDEYSAFANALAEQRPGTDRDLLACRVGAARCLAALGRTPEALHDLEALLPVQEQAFGPMDSSVFDTRYEIASLTARGGRTRAARDQLALLRGDQRGNLPADDARHDRVEQLLVRLDRFLKGT